MWHGYYIVGWWWMPVLGMLLCGGIVALIVWAVRRPGDSGDGHRSVHDGTAMDYLRERYAKGEISREEFERIRDDLMRK